MAKSKWTAADIPDLTGKTAIVTGANSGIGYETALALAGKGARVVLACRNQTTGEDAVTRIRTAHPKTGDASFAHLDLGDLASVRSFAAEMATAHPVIDILCNNAGVMMCPRGHTADGFETQLGTNHLGHFALTGLLFDQLSQSPSARVVTVASVYHRRGRIDFDNLNSEKRYSKTRAYAQSKIANLLFTFELQRRCAATGKPIIAVAAHPGWTATNLQQNAALFRVLNPVFAQQPWSGARPTLYAATAPDVRGGEYFGPDRRFELIGGPTRVKAVKRAHDEQVASRLWQISAELTGVSYL